MHMLFLVLACLACPGSARRMQSSHERLQSRSSKEIQESLKEPLQWLAGGWPLPNSSKVLATFLLAENSAAGFSSSGHPSLSNAHHRQAHAGRRLNADSLSASISHPMNHKARVFRDESSRVLGPELQQMKGNHLDDVPAEAQKAKNAMTPTRIQQEFDQQMLDEAYEKCQKVTSAASKTFYLGSTLLSEEQKKAMWAIYTWCRRTDDLVDSPLAMMNAKKMTDDLSAWEARLHNIWEGEAYDTLDLALLDTRKKHPSLSVEPFVDMIEGMKMDTPQFGQNRYNTWDELYLYCYRVASTVGLMTLPVFGTARGYTEEQAKSPAIALGIALQITNILRDVGEDARRGRIYLPLEDMEKFGVTEHQILIGKLDSNYVDLVKFEIQRARDYYKQAQDGIPMLAPAARLGVQAAADVYSQILDKLEQNGYDNFNQRTFVTGIEKLQVVLRSWWTVSQMRE